MLETTKILFTDGTRDLIKKFKESPILYLFFTGMILFSIATFAVTTFLLTKVETNLDIELNDVYFIIFFIFFIKSTVDFYNKFIKSHEITYALSTQEKHIKTAFQVFLYILFSNLIIWLSFSFLFLIIVNILGLNVFYPIEYLLFTSGIITATCVGGSICINYFSPKIYRIIPTAVLIIFYLYSRNMYFVSLTLPLAFLHIIWSVNNSISSYLYIRRKKRKRGKNLSKNQGILKAIFHKETTILWRDNLFFSYIFTSAVAGFASGYFYLYGDEILIPEAVRDIYGGFLPSLFVFLGVYVVVIYTAVFPSLNLFLNEEKTMWIVKHVPVKNDLMIYGKASALTLCFIATLPFIPYISIFLGFTDFFYLTWFIVYSFIAGVIISVPLGVKYVGKKSDIMLLYSIAMILFLFLGFTTYIARYIQVSISFFHWIFILMLIIEIIILFLSLKISSKILSNRYPG